MKIINAVITIPPYPGCIVTSSDIKNVLMNEMVPIIGRISNVPEVTQGIEIVYNNIYNSGGYIKYLRLWR